MFHIKAMVIFFLFYYALEKEEKYFEEISSGGRYVISNGLLMILNVQKEDHGNYICIVSNGVGNVLEGKASLSVLSKL